MINNSELLLAIQQAPALVSAIVLLAGIFSLLNDQEYQLRCYEKSVILYGFYVVIVLVFFLINVIERVTIGSAYILELVIQIRRLTRPTVMEARPVMWECLILLPIMSLCTAIFHISARPCACTIRTPVPMECRRRG